MIIGLTCLWSCSFISMSYFFSQYISLKNKSATFVPFLILATCLNLFIAFGMTNSQLRESEIRGVLTVVFTFGPTSALILRCFYDIIPGVIKPSVYAPGCLDAINRSLFIAPFFWLALAIFKDYWDNRITQKNVFLNDLVDEKSGGMKSDKEMFKDRNKKTKVNPLAQNIGEEVPPEEDNEEEEINGLTEQIILANQRRTDIPIQASRISMLFKNDNNSFYALKDVSIILDKNETLGLLGPNGAGKSTLFNIISTYHDATGGSIRTFGEELNTYSSFFTECGLCA
jgi:ABC-type multidrug transport system fused ATPase/permease subunit